MTTLLALSLGMAHARPPVLTIEALTEAGDPLPTAVVRFVEEGERHRVHGQTEAWAGSALWHAPGLEIPMEPGMLLHLEVWAPGHRYVIREVEIERRRGNVLKVELPEVVLAAADGATYAEQQTFARAQAWVEAAGAFRADPTEATHAARYERRMDLLEAVLVWLGEGAAPDARAVELCAMAASDPRACGR